MKYICWAARLVFTLMLIQLTIIAINFAPSASVQIPWKEAIRPSNAIYHSINYMGTHFNLSLNLSYLLVLVIACLLSILYYKLGLILTGYLRKVILKNGKKEKAEQ